MQHHIGPATREALNWRSAVVSGTGAFQPSPHVTKHDFKKSIEGEWIGLYSYLSWADFEALRDNNPAVVEANRAGHLRDFLGGPQELTIQLQKSGPEGKLPKKMGKESNSTPITGKGTNGGPFTFNGKLRRVYLPSDVAGKDMILHWRVTFVKTYVNGENSWTRWIYDGIYCPGVGILGRWRDGTEPEGTGVTGPFWLWPKAPKAKSETSKYEKWDEAYDTESSQEFATEFDNS